MDLITRVANDLLTVACCFVTSYVEPLLLPVVQDCTGAKQNRDGPERQSMRRPGPLAPDRASPGPRTPHGLDRFRIQLQRVGLSLIKHDDLCPARTLPSPVSRRVIVDNVFARSDQGSCVLFSVSCCVGRLNATGSSVSVLVTYTYVFSSLQDV